MINSETPLPLGEVVVTPGALEALRLECRYASEFLSRHARRDWGSVSDRDWQANDQALRDGGRILSAYALTCGVRLWIITEADRSATTVLLADEY